MARLCSVCEHDQRVVIDRLIGAGNVAERSLAEQFGVSATAIHRHKEHVVAAVRRTVERKEIERDRAIASVWRERLERSYGLAEAGAEFAAGDPKQWPQGARFLAVMSKLIETGLEVDGVIGPAAVNAVTTTTEQVLILPTIHRPSATIESTCELDEPES